MTNYPLAIFLFIFFAACNGQSVLIPKDNKTTHSTTTTNASNLFGLASNTALKGIRVIFQDKKDAYWLGSDGSGVFYYDGKTLVQFTVKDGLCDNQIRTIQEDKAGNIWLGTGNGISRYDGKTFTTLPNNKTTIIHSKIWKIEDKDLWFEVGGGVYRSDGNTFAYLPLPSTKLDSNYAQAPSSPISPFTIYCTFKDKAGNLWFGTQSLGVCRYDGQAFTWFGDKNLAGFAVLAIFQDKTGNMWFGNNGGGLFRYDGQTLTNITAEKGLENPAFRTTGKAKQGTLARIYSIHEDNKGNIWIGTIDAGAWRYYHNTLTNYTTRDGLPSNTVNVIYNDTKGDLWFGTAGDGIYQFNGTSFVAKSFKWGAN